MACRGSFEEEEEMTRADGWIYIARGGAVKAFYSIVHHPHPHPNYRPPGFAFCASARAVKNACHIRQRRSNTDESVSPWLSPALPTSSRKKQVVSRCHTHPPRALKRRSSHLWVRPSYLYSCAASSVACQRKANKLRRLPPRPTGVLKRRRGLPKPRQTVAYFRRVSTAAESIRKGKESKLQWSLIGQFSSDLALNDLSLQLLSLLFALDYLTVLCHTTSTFVLKASLGLPLFLAAFNLSYFPLQTDHAIMTVLTYTIRDRHIWKSTLLDHPSSTSLMQGASESSCDYAFYLLMDGDEAHILPIYYGLKNR